MDTVSSPSESSSATAVLEARALVRTFEEGSVKTEVLKGVSLSLQSGELVAVIGKSGSGKSTLLHLLGTLDTPTSGELFFEGNPLTGRSAAQLARFRNQSLGFVYQFHHLLGDFSALENVMFPLLIGGQSTQEAARTARQFLEQVGLEQRLDYRPGELSGGERQRTAIARALCTRPKLVLADEPTGNLDDANSRVVFELFLTLVRREGSAVIMVTHDEALAGRCDRVLHLSDGVLK
ncbi:MAG: ATP-binding cassette domain-containing protein [Succinivibrio sp.]|nr:ATP-binding cassette domain-containing protein [Succinivibrio sp.]